MKPDVKQMSTCKQNDYLFDYQGKKNALLGKEGEFDVKRIVVFQFK